MINLERRLDKPAAYATLPIRTTKDRCVALALATTNLTTFALLLAAWICADTIPYRRGSLPYSQIYADFSGTLGPFNFLTTILCILASYLFQGRGWRVLFAFCALLGIIYFCLTACPAQLARE